MGKKIVTTEEENKYIVNNDGEIVEQLNTYTTKLSVSETEPRYVKLYLDDIAKLEGITGSQNSVLLGILKLTQFSTNEVILNTISNFVKREILFKIATGVYKLNPYLFGSGTWQQIKGLRMTIEYTEQGKTMHVEEITENEVACSGVSP